MFSGLSKVFSWFTQTQNKPTSKIREFNAYYTTDVNVWFKEISGRVRDVDSQPLETFLKSHLIALGDNLSYMTAPSVYIEDSGKTLIAESRSFSVTDGISVDYILQCLGNFSALYTISYVKKFVYKDESDNLVESTPAIIIRGVLK